MAGRTNRTSLLPGLTYAPTLARALRPPRPLLSTPRRSDRDQWLAEDKLKHFFMSFAATSFAFGGARTVGLDTTPALLVGVGSAAVAGVGKEWYDVRTGGRFSWKDLAWDGLGILAGVLLLANVE